jgi:hypothetical protein
MRLGRESRWRPKELIPGEFPQIERRLVSIIQDRVELDSMRDDDKGSLEQRACLVSRSPDPFDQI